MKQSDNYALRVLRALYERCGGKRSYVSLHTLRYHADLRSLSIERTRDILSDLTALNLVVSGMDMYGLTTDGTRKLEKMILDGERTEYFTQPSLEPPSNRTRVMRPIGGGNSDVRRALAQAWLNGTFDDRAIETILTAESSAASVDHIHSPGLGVTIRSDDLKIVDAVLAGVTAAAGSGFFLDGATPQAIAAVVAAAAKLVWNLRQKSVLLDPLQSQLMSILVGCRAMTVREIAELGFRTAQEHSSTWSPELVQDVLESLKAVRVRDGTVVALVAMASDGRWSAAGV